MKNGRVRSCNVSKSAKESHRNRVERRGLNRNFIGDTNPSVGILPVQVVSKWWCSKLKLIQQLFDTSGIVVYERIRAAKSGSGLPGSPSNVLAVVMVFEHMSADNMLRVAVQ